MHNDHDEIQSTVEHLRLLEECEMTMSATIGALAKALSLAQGEMGHAIKDAENPAFKRGAQTSRYADLASVIDAIRGPFMRHGLAYSQSIVPSAEFAIVRTTVMHESGEWIASEIYLPVAAKTPHAFGSALTYARRYSLAAAAGISQADDDGNAGSMAASTTDEHVVVNLIASMEEADTLDDLKTAYLAAISLCDDDASRARLISAKDARKAAIAAKAAA